MPAREWPAVEGATRKAAAEGAQAAASDLPGRRRRHGQRVSRHLADVRRGADRLPRFLQPFQADLGIRARMPPGHPLSSGPGALARRPGQHRRVTWYRGSARCWGGIRPREARWDRFRNLGPAVPAGPYSRPILRAGRLP
jgi:hypothetical protein